MLTIIAGDAHAPFHDTDKFGTFLDVVKTLKPDRVVIAGDWWDNYQMSRFDRDPKRLKDLQDDLDSGKDLLLQVRKAARKSVMTVMEGNHEFRLHKFVVNNPEFDSLRCLEPTRFFGIHDLSGVSWVRYGQFVDVEGVRILHGHLVRKRSGYTAHAYLDMYWQSGVSGHTHRLGHIYRKAGNTAVSWVEAGCLCGLNPEYMPQDASDWQHGYATVKNGVPSVWQL